MGLYDSNNVILANGKDVTNGQKSYDLSAVGNLETFNNNYHCGAIVVNVASITTGAELSVFCNLLRRIIGYSANGDLVRTISSPGRYIFPVDITMQSVILRCSTAATSATALVIVGWAPELPAGIESLKPLQRILSVSSAIASSAEFTLISQNNDIVAAMLNKFKYYFFSYYISNSGSAAPRVCHITAQPYQMYDALRAGKFEEVSVESGYSFQSNWKEINGDALRFFAKIDDAAAGDNIVFNLYGVR